MILSQALRDKIDHAIKKYPSNQKKAAVKSALMYAQDENKGWLTQEIMNAIADYLEMPHIAVYEVATFYSLFELKPVGEFKISLCTNISCKLRGSDELINCIEKKLNISLGETTKDGKFTLKEVECIAACAGAPALQINNTYYENLDPQSLEDLLVQLESK